MKRNKKIFVILFFAAVFCLFALLIAGPIKNRISDYLSESAENSKEQINWEEIYPFDKKIDTVTGYSSEVKTSKLSIMKDKAENLGNIGENLLSTLPGRNYISKIGYPLVSLFKDLSIGQDWIKLKNGYWIRSSKTSNLEASKNKMLNYFSLQEYCESNSINFLYFFTPQKLCMYSDELPLGAESKTNETINCLVAYAEETGLNYVDLRASLHNDGLDHYSMFFKTDTHWTLESGMWAASTIEKELQSRFQLNTENVVDLGDYSKTTYKNAMFGNIASTVTHFLEDSEDFDVFSPEFETDFLVEVPKSQITKEGSFDEVLYDKEGLEDLVKKSGGYAYKEILYAEQPYVKITNLKNENGPKILILNDSFARAVAPYLALSCSEIVLIDTRQDNGNFDGSVINCIDDFKPDVVLALMSAPHKLILNK